MVVVDEFASFLRYSRNVRQTDSVDDVKLPNPVLSPVIADLSTFSLLFERNDVPKDGLLVPSFLVVLRGLGGEGDRFLKLAFRECCATPGRKAGSRRGVGASEPRDGFLFTRRGDEGACVGVLAAGGEVASPSVAVF